MSSEDVYTKLLAALERYGFGICLAVAILWFARVDIIVPMVESHKHFLEEVTKNSREMSQTQAEIGRAIEEQTRTLETQTRLLYAMCPPSVKVPTDIRRLVQASSDETSQEN